MTAGREFEHNAEWVDGLEKRGTVEMSVRPLHRFIGRAVGIRSEVITVLHLLDKPDETWDDPSMDAIYDDLRDEFDLGDRHDALEHKLKNLQESLELILDVARDRRLFLLGSEHRGPHRDRDRPVAGASSLSGRESASGSNGNAVCSWRWYRPPG
jgi:hypothetical protein